MQVISAPYPPKLAAEESLAAARSSRLPSDLSEFLERELVRPAKLVAHRHHCRNGLPWPAERPVDIECEANVPRFLRLHWRRFAELIGQRIAGFNTCFRFADARLEQGCGRDPDWYPRNVCRLHMENESRTDLTTWPDRAIPMALRRVADEMHRWIPALFPGEAARGDRACDRSDEYPQAVGCEDRPHAAPTEISANEQKSVRGCAGRNQRPGNYLATIPHVHADVR
jgi:hypothetical protein